MSEQIENSKSTTLKREDIERQLQALDPQSDCVQIMRYLSNYLFPFDFEKSLEFALFRTYAIPSISDVLKSSGEFKSRPRKRYDDTELLLACPLEFGLESSEGKRAIKRINAMHDMYDISNDDFLYVLSTFVFETPRWMEQFAARACTQNEKLGLFNYYKILGQRLKIKDIPDDIDSFEKFNRDYEQKHMRYAHSNALIGNATVDLILGMYVPRFMFFIARPAVYALMDERLARAFAFPKMPKFLFKILKITLKARAWLASKLPVKLVEFSKVKRPTYPEGYEIEELGTFKCPYHEKSS